jgi:tRNA-dihydrouridine synthase
VVERSAVNRLVGGSSPSRGATILTIPLTVKFRLGRDHTSLSYLELGRICAGEGADAVAMHARTARQMFAGDARAQWGEIARLKEALAIPVFGNGDVKEPQDALAMMAATGCDGVLVGRAATKNPWIFRQAADLLAGRPRPPRRSPSGAS